MCRDCAHRMSELLTQIEREVKKNKDKYQSETPKDSRDVKTELINEIRKRLQEVR